MQSIKSQCNIYICDDCSTDNYSEIIKQFSPMIDITYLKLDKNSGAGITRQFGIDKSNGEYIVFIDSDDAFCNPFSIELLYEKMIEDNSTDVVVGNFEEQVDINNKIEFIMHGLNSIWLHGKMFKRKFLTDNNIRFNNTRLNEDVYFLGIVWVLTSNIAHIDKSISFWITNESSLTRNIADKLARFKTILGFVDNQTKLYLEKKRRGVEESKISIQQSVDALIVLYFYANEIFKLYDDEYGNTFLDACSEFYSKVWNDVKKIATNEYLNERYTAIITDMNSAKIYIPVMTLYEFVNIIKK